MSHDCGTAQQQKRHCMRVDVRLWPVRHPRMRRSGVGEVWVVGCVEVTTRVRSSGREGGHLILTRKKEFWISKEMSVLVCC
jgi:hypothetical protein